MKILKGLLMAGMTLLAGCATQAETQQDIAANGAAPTQYEAKIKAHFSTHPYPDSIRYQKISTPMKCHASKDGAAYVDGWCATATIDAADQDGKRTGWQDYSFVFRGEELLFVVLRDYKPPRRLEQSR